MFPGPPSPANFLVYGDGLSGGYQDLPAYFTIQVRDQYGNNITDGGESFSFDFIRVRTGDQVHNISYIDNFDGTYSVSYVAPLPGAYNLTIYSGDEELVGRYSILILPGAAKAHTQHTVSLSNLTLRSQSTRGGPLVVASSSPQPARPLTSLCSTTTASPTRILPSPGRPRLRYVARADAVISSSG